MKKWFLLILLFVVPSLVCAEPFLSTRGPIMERLDADRVIIVNEMRIFIQPSTSITDEKGRTLDFHHLKRGLWVLVEAEPDEDLGMVANSVVLIRKN